MMTLRSARLASFLSRSAPVIAYVLALGLILRFCARAYPGIYVPESRVLNAVFNGDLFGFGYVAAIAAGLIHLGQFTLAFLGRRAPRPLAPIRNGLIAACLALAAFGLYVAFVLHRLPGMHDGG